MAHFEARLDEEEAVLEGCAGACGMAHFPRFLGLSKRQDPSSSYSCKDGTNLWFGRAGVKARAGTFQA